MFVRGVFGEFSLQGAAMHFECACCGRHVSLMLVQDALNVFVGESIHGEGSGGDVGIRIGHVRFEGGQDRRDVDRFGQILNCTELDRFHGGGDAGVACQQHNLAEGVDVDKFWNQRQAGNAAQIEVENNPVRPYFLRQREGIFGRARALRFDAVACEGLHKSLIEGFIVVDYEQDWLHDESARWES